MIIRRIAKRFLYTVSLATFLGGVYYRINGDYFNGAIGVAGGFMLFFGAMLRSDVSQEERSN